MHYSPARMLFILPSYLTINYTLLEPWLLVAVTPQEIRERVNLTEADISDVTVNRFAKAAAVTVGLELEKTIDYTGCSDEEAEAIRNIAAVYCACKVTGGSSSGLSFRVGDLSVNESSGTTPSGLSRENLQFLMNEALRIIEGIKEPYVRVA
jgi:hypothetical protein